MHCWFSSLCPLQPGSLHSIRNRQHTKCVITLISKNDNSGQLFNECILEGRIFFKEAPAPYHLWWYHLFLLFAKGVAVEEAPEFILGLRRKQWRDGYVFR